VSVSVPLPECLKKSNLAGIFLGFAQSEQFWNIVEMHFASRRQITDSNWVNLVLFMPLGQSVSAWVNLVVSLPSAHLPSPSHRITVHYNGTWHHFTLNYIIPSPNRRGLESQVTQTQITNYKPESQTTNYKSQFTNHESQITNHKSQNNPRSYITNTLQYNILRCMESHHTTLQAIALHLHYITVYDITIHYITLH
jgi:hypothetical protein